MKTAQSIKELLKSGNFTYINPEIENVFKTEPIRSKVELRNFGRSISSEDAIKELKKEGCVPANATELFEFAARNTEWEGKYIVALGSIASFEGKRRVPYVWWHESYREVYLCWFDRDWDDRYWFAFSRESSDTKKQSLDPLQLDLEARVTHLERIIAHHKLGENVE